MRLLVVDDDRALRDTLSRALRLSGYDVRLAENGSDALAEVASGVPDAVILDIGLPDIDGLDVCRMLRRDGNRVPILMLTARDAVSDRIDGLDAGADDYLGKPFAVEELLARIRALLRRPAETLADALHIAALSFDFTHCEASVAGQRMELPRRELLALETLVRRAGRTVLRGALERAVFGFDAEIQSNALDTHVSRLRKKLADTGAGVEICSIRGVGYLLRQQP